MKKILPLLFISLFYSCSFFTSKKVKLDLIPYKQDSLYGYFDKEGKIAINPQFSNATLFRDGLALVQTSGKDAKWGYIDESGKFVINATYLRATVFNDGVAWVVTENGAPTAIDTNGKSLFTLNDAEEVKFFSDDLAAFSVKDSSGYKWGFVDKNGVKKINPQFASVGVFSENKCEVSNKEGKWGYIDNSGKLIINYQFDSADSFKNGKAVVLSDKKAGVIDENGKYIINPQYDNIYLDGENYLIQQDDKFGWCDKDGKIIINPQFEIAYYFGDSNLAAVKSGDNYCYIDKEGKITINPQFQYAFPFFDEVAIVSSGDKFGLIDKEGKYVANPQFENIATDVMYYLSNPDSNNSAYSRIRTDYFDTSKISKTIDFNNPSDLSFTATFPEIAKKFSIPLNDFGYGSMNSIFRNKEIDDNATYSFSVFGEALDINSSSKQFNNKAPLAYVYKFDFKNKGEGKNEAIAKIFEKKLSNFTLLKRGYINADKVIVYENKTQKVLFTISGDYSLEVVIVKNEYDLSEYISSIKDEPEEEAPAAEYDYDAEAAVDSTAVEAPEDYDY